MGEPNIGHIIGCSREDLVSRVRRREGEQKIGEKTWVLRPGEGLDDLAGYAEKGGSIRPVGDS